MISIILPAYNAEKTIKETIDSIYAQTFQDWELIIINDQSSDDTQKILNTYRHTENKCNRTPVFLNTEDIHDKGIVAALNYGISKASGEFIARIDADDKMRSQRLEWQNTVLTQDPEINLVTGNAEIFNEHGFLQSIIISTDSLDKLSERCCIVHPSVMWRKEYFDKNDLKYRKEYEYIEDYDLWLRFRLSPSPAYAKINQILIDYRISDNSISSNKFTEQRDKTKKLFKEFNIPPYLSIIDLTNSDPENFIKEINNQKYFNYEIVKTLKEAKGKLIAFNKFENIFSRFDVQVQFLNDNLNYVGCGTYIQKQANAFFYTPEPHLIEKELLRGHIVIEPGTFVFRNIPKAYSKLNIKNDNDIFQLYCNLLKFGKLTNIRAPLVKCDDYTTIKHENLTARIKYAKGQYRTVINVVQLNITSDGNFSGVDRYIETLGKNLPENFRVMNITFIASDRIEWKLNQEHIKIYYNPKQTKLESMYDMFWDNLNQYFIFRPNLIVQSNCLNLFSLITYLRRKVNLVHVCCMHCVPYREVIRFDRKKYVDLELLFEDESEDFVDSIEHQLPLTLADHVILNTKDAEQYYNRCGYLTPYTIINNGIELINNELINNQKQKSVNEVFKFIFVGHSSPLKGFDQLLPIIEEVSKDHKIEILWAGAAEQEIRQIIAKKKLPVKIFGVIPPEKLNQLYLLADAALIASACETCSYAAIEALSAGLPIIATRAHGVTEIVENIGLLVDIDKSGIINKGMYIDAMKKVISDPELRKQMTEKSKNRYKSYSVDKMVDKTINLYKSLLKV
jgi:glycosyltransferase involved in cell wall biosynthesis